MVMSLMRRHATSYLIKFLIGMIAIVFIFYFGYSFKSQNGFNVASVNGEVITGQEYQRAYQDLLQAVRTQYKSMWNDSLIKVLDLRNRALERLIDQKLIHREVKRLGLGVSDEEVRKAIMDYPAFQVNGQFNVDRYRGLLGQNQMQPADFEAGIADDLLQGKVKEFLLAFSPVSDQEVYDYYTYNNEKVKIRFVAFTPDAFKKTINPDPAALEAYFKEHREAYRVPERIRVSYLEFDPAAFKDQVKVTDSEIKAYYDAHTDAFQEPTQVKASHILLKLPENAKPEEEKKVKERAEEVLKEARQGKDFAALAKKYSEDSTKAKGGELGYIKPGQMVKPFEEAAFGLKKGEISDLVRTPFGYHIIKVEDVKEAKTKSLDQAKDQIRDQLIREASRNLAQERAFSVSDGMPYPVDLAKYAQEQKLQARTSDFFSQGTPIPGIGGDGQVTQGLFAQKEKETSELSEINGKFYIFQVVERKASYLPEMNEVADKVKADVVSDLASKEAKSEAEGFLKELRGGKDWDRLVDSKKMKSVQTDLFGRHDSVPEVGYAPEIAEAAFGLSKEKPYPDKVFTSDQRVYVIRWEGKEGINSEQYQKELERYRFALMQTKQNNLFQSWLADLKKKAEIKVLTPVDRG